MLARTHRPILVLLASVAAAVAVSAAEPAPACPPGESPVIAVDGVLDPWWLPLFRAAEELLAPGYQAFHDFRFTDRLPESGITFVHRIVADAGKDYKAVHYDHGNGLAVADVDGDGRLDLYFTTQLGENELWRNAGGGRFTELADAGVGVGDAVSVAASFADADNDGDPDLFVTTVRGGNRLFRNDGGGRFTDVTAASGLGYVGHSSGAVFFDYDRDGLVDLFVANVGDYTSDERGPGGYWIGYEDAFSGHLFPERTETSRLYRNEGGLRFRDVSEETGLVDGGWSGDAAPFDVDADGWTDLYVLSMQGHDEVWRNVEGREGKGRRFERVGRDYFPATPWGTMGVQVLDVDNDGRMDVYVTDMHTDMIEVLPPQKEKSKMPRQRPLEALGTDGNHVLGNALFHNLGPGADGRVRFEEVSQAMNAESFWPWGLSAGDLNADGWVDVFITASMNHPWRYGVNSLLLNDLGTRFVDAAFLTGVEPRRGARTAKPWFDLDCSGADAAEKACEGKSGCVTVMGALGSRSSAILDVDADGDLDVVTNDFNSAPLVLVSDLAARRPVRFLQIDLTGTRSNRSGLGARVEVTAGGRTVTRVNDGTSGYLSHSDAPLYFGLGDAAAADRVVVTWPSGIRQELPAPVAAGSRITIVETPPASP